MIKRFTEIKNLGLFEDFEWNPNLTDFARFNVIYGWNGSGKTTLSQFFTFLEEGQSEEFPSLRYKVESNEGELCQGIKYTKNIRVFNQLYVSRNIDMVSCTATPIYILGEENKKLIESIRQDEFCLKGNPDIPGDIGKLRELKRKEGALDNKEKELGEYFSNVARTIGTNTLGALARNYRKNNAERDFEKLESKKILNQDDFEKNQSLLRQQEMETLGLKFFDNISDDIENLIEEAENLLKTTVDVVIIPRLQENPDISQWVEEGLHLHHDKKSYRCEFCGQLFSDDRKQELLADKKLKDDIDSVVKRIESVLQKIQNITIVDKANLYPDIRDEYSAIKDVVEEDKHKLIFSIRSLIREIENKKLHTTEELSLNERIDFARYDKSLEALLNCIKKHNDMSSSFSKLRDSARETLKNHYLSEIFDQIHTLRFDIAEIRNEIDILKNGNPEIPEDIGIIGLQARIDVQKNKVSQSGPACDELNSQLATFLGRKELQFEICEEGYILKRNGELAANLSEGEKTAVAFVYFTIHMKDRDFNRQSDVVVIDDPISSLDSNSLFQAFSFLKNSVQNCYQVFIFTHNYDFLHLILNWLENARLKKMKSYYMIKNPYVNGRRIAQLGQLDKLLIEFQSEYQYLFKTLYCYKPDDTIESAYNLPNIARKVLDNFLMVMIPDNSSPYRKLELINFDENKKAAIYKFTNDQSHITGKGFDPSLTSECKNVITYLLEMIETVFPTHYKILVELCK